ncbi:MAG: 6,7-dimethyl-8-ribityllumazine synthase [Candidatus Acetothermia bacterium]|jgi:6,7-dimethyl-8-ribityllumazine synthase|nr:6,7-dimethyl-8-ribityllumazine synthase [Candidatus Acetothermia bacterium]MDH7505279.1 6,7-dimethyl-8-ribityllumazine synthase [Candidatus Acetothermia bacterium]
MSEFSGSPDGKGLRIAIVVSRFNSAITERLLAGAVERLIRGGVKREAIDVYWVPGSFELPQTVRKLIKAEKYDGIIPLGCLIRGETLHFEVLARAVTAELLRLSLEGTPLVFGVLTADTAEQALARAGVKSHKGVQAAESLLELIGLLRQI